MKAELFDELLSSVRQGSAILRGKAAPSRVFSMDGLEIKSIRNGYKLSPSKFAALLGVSAATLRNWEQGRETPEGPARVLLQIASRHPEAVWDVVGSKSRAKRSDS